MGDRLHTMTFVGENWRKGVEGALQSVAWVILSTISNMLGYTPMHLIFSKDMIMQFKVTAD